MLSPTFFLSGLGVLSFLVWVLVVPPFACSARCFAPGVHVLCVCTFAKPLSKLILYVAFFFVEQNEPRRVGPWRVCALRTKCCWCRKLVTTQCRGDVKKQKLPLYFWLSHETLRFPPFSCVVSWGDVGRSVTKEQNTNTHKTNPRL